MWTKRDFTDFEMGAKLIDTEKKFRFYLWRNRKIENKLSWLAAKKRMTVQMLTVELSVHTFCTLKSSVFDEKPRVFRGNLPANITEASTERQRCCIRETRRRRSEEMMLTGVMRHSQMSRCSLHNENRKVQVDVKRINYYQVYYNEKDEDDSESTLRSSTWKANW